jgi:hypothetical protein
MAVAKNIRFDHARLADDALGSIAAVIDRRLDRLNYNVTESGRLGPRFSGRLGLRRLKHHVATCIRFESLPLGWAFRAGRIPVRRCYEKLYRRRARLKQHGSLKKSTSLHALVRKMCFNPCAIARDYEHFDTFSADRLLRLRVNPSAAIAALAVIIAVTLAFGGRATADFVPGGVKIKTRDGTVHGTIRGDVAEFLGIPYAMAPVGELRWQPPKRHVHWSGILDASRAGSACAQMRFRHPGMEGSEDCLYLTYIHLKARAADFR